MEILNEFNGVILFQTWIGALCTHLLSLYNDEFKGTIPFIQRLVPEKTDAFYTRIDFIILPIIGALLAYVLLDPSSLKSSIFAGISWSGTLLAMLRKSNKNTENSGNE